MDWNRIQHNWEEFKPRVRECWARLAPSEIDEIRGKREHLVDRIQGAYGLPRDEAEQQVSEFETKVDPSRGWDGPAGPGRRTDRPKAPRNRSKGGDTMKLHSLKDLYVEELRDLHSAEKQLVASMPKMAKAVTSDTLREAMETHMDETKRQVDRLDQIFRSLNISPGGHKCEGIAGILSEAGELLKADADPDVLDAAIIAQAQRVEHYEIAGYGCARSYASLLGREGDVTLLQETLDEEGKTDHLLTEIAERHINERALAEP